MTSAKKACYVIQVLTGHEHKVLKALNDRIARADLAHKFGKILVPTEEVMEMRQGQKRTVAQKLYPGYILVEMEMDDSSWHLVQGTSGVVKLVGGNSSKPVPLSAGEVAAIQQQMQEGAEKPRHKVLFEAGEVVQVVDGPFAEFSGEVEEVNYEKNRLRVSVVIFGRATPVELEFSQVQKA